MHQEWTLPYLLSLEKDQVAESTPINEATLETEKGDSLI